jgi:hypothetical protein
MSDGQWQLEGTAAELFERYLVPAITAKWAADLLDRAQPGEGERFWTSLAAPALWRAWRQSEWVEGW